MLAYRLSQRTMQFSFAGAVVALLALNICLSYSFGHSHTMTSNPIYRWRESVAIALSKMRDNPMPGYLAYGSIHKYIVQHGLGLLDGEANPLPKPDALFALIHDPVRLNKLFQDASKVAIDHSLPPTKLQGNELGLAEYYYWAFSLFGVSLFAMWAFYFVLLAIAVLLFYGAFRASPFCLYLLLLYLTGHAYLVSYANIATIETIHNSRFFPTLAILPAMHLLLLLIRREKPNLSTVGLAAGQTFIFIFVIFCRAQTSWQAVAIVACAFIAVRYRLLFVSFRYSRSLVPALKMVTSTTWPALLVVLGYLILTIYLSVATDQRYAGDRTHVFWHTLYAGMVSASPKLGHLYSYGKKRYGDNIAYFAVLNDLRERHDSSPSIAFVQNGKIYINIWNNFGEYDRLVRRVFFKIVLRHPWLALKSFIYDKPHDQMIFLQKYHAFEPLRLGLVGALGLGATFMFYLLGGASARLQRIKTVAPYIVVVLIFSMTTTLVLPTSLIVGSLLVYFILFCLIAFYLPCGALLRCWPAAKTQL
jgi:hypothetical protein